MKNVSSNQSLTHKKNILEVTKRIIEKRVGVIATGWPPSCSSLLYQPPRMRNGKLVQNEKRD